MSDQTGRGERQHGESFPRPSAHGGEGGERLPPGVEATPEDSPSGKHYMYRPGEVLILKRDVELLTEAGRLADTGCRRAAGVDERDATLAELGIERWVTGGYVPDVVDALRAPLVGVRDPVTGEDHDYIPGVYPDHAFHFHYHDWWFHGFDRTPAGVLTDLPRRRFPPLPGEGVRIGVLDTGISKADRDWFDGRVRASRGASDEDPLSAVPGGPLDPIAGHGTHIAGTIRRFAPGARITVRAIDNRHGPCVFDSDVPRALAELAETGVDIINCAFGGWTNDNAGAVCMERAIDQLRQSRPKLIVVASAGNTGVADPQYPAAFKTVVGVGAVNPRPAGDAPYERAEFSNYGSWVDAAAPGIQVHSTFIDWESLRFRGWAKMSGTSMAVPIVTAAIATEYRPGGWRQYLWFLLPKSARQAAYRLINNHRSPFDSEVGTVIDPPPYANPA